MTSCDLDWLPIGYMISFYGNELPPNFIEVDGQTLSKIEHSVVFDAFRGRVAEFGNTFLLPTKKELNKLFNSLEDARAKIIVKLC